MQIHWSKMWKDARVGKNLNEVLTSERSSQHGASHFPTQRYSKPSAADQKQQLFWPEPGSVLATTPAAVRPVPCLSLFPSLAEWWRLIVQNEKAKPIRVFSSLISQVQSNWLWAGNYIWSEKEWLLATERSNRSPFQRLTTDQRLLNTAIFQPAMSTLCHVTTQIHRTYTLHYSGSQ